MGAQSQKGPVSKTREDGPGEGKLTPTLLLPHILRTMGLASSAKYSSPGRLSLPGASPLPPKAPEAAEGSPDAGPELEEDATTGASLSSVSSESSAVEGESADAALRPRGRSRMRDDLELEKGRGCRGSVWTDGPGRIRTPTRPLAEIRARAGVGAGNEAGRVHDVAAAGVCCCSGSLICIQRPARGK